MTEKSAAGRKPSFNQDDIANAIADLRRNKEAIKTAGVVQWLKDAGVAKSPSAESVKKIMQEVLDREREEEERRLLGKLPSAVIDDLEPGMKELTTHIHLMLARSHENMNVAVERTIDDANATIRRRDANIAALEEELQGATKHTDELAQQLEKANKRIGSLLSEREKLEKKVVQLTSAKLTLKETLRDLRVQDGG